MLARVLRLRATLATVVRLAGAVVLALVHVADDAGRSTVSDRPAALQFAIHFGMFC